MRIFLALFACVFATVADAQLFSDDFTRGVDPGPLFPWAVHSGTWSVTGGVLNATNVLNSFGFAYITNSWTNYSVQARVRFSSTNADGGGIGGRFNPYSGGQYAAWISPEGSPSGSNILQLLKFQYWEGYEYSNTTWQMMRKIPLPSVGTNWHTLKLSLQGNQISVYYDSNLVTTATDTESNPFWTGGICAGLSTANAAYTMFMDDVVVTPLPSTLIAVNDSYYVNQSGSLVVPSPGVLNNDTPGAITNLAATKLTNPSNGTLTFNSNGGFTYVPNNNFIGVDSFTYQATDGVSNSAPATVAIDVTPSTNIFYDNFTRTGTGNSFAPWVTGLGEWSIAGGVMLGSGTIPDDYSDAYVPATVSDFSIQARFQLPTGAWACGLSGRLNPLTGERYVANVYPEGSPLGPTPALRLIKFHTWGTWSSTYTAMALVGLPRVGTTSHTLKLAFYGNTIDVYFDGSRVVHAIDDDTDDLPPYRSGAFGAHMYMYSPPYQATFDDLTVSALPPFNFPPVLPAQTNFTIAPLANLIVTNTATDTDIPTNSLTYILTGPAGAAIDTNGVITWTPTLAQDLTTNLFTTVVTDFSPGATNALHLSATNSFVVIVNSQSTLVVDSTTLLAEGCAPTNNAIDPGETVTMQFALRNTGIVDTTNLVATLLTSGGVTLPSGPQSYGSLPGGGAAVAQPFTFTAAGSCGGTITASLQLQDGTRYLGTVTVPFTLGQMATFYTQTFDTVTAPALPAGWTTSTSGAGTSWITQVATNDTPPNAAFCPDVLNIGTSDLLSPLINLPPGTSVLTFAHYYDLEPNTATDGFDAGVLDIKIGNNPFTDILAAGGSFAANGYDHSINSSSGNPLGGRQGWSGTSPGFVTTIVNLPAAAQSQTVQFRWRCGTDSSNGRTGWRIDSVGISSRACCANSAPSLAAQSDRTIAELTSLLVTNTATDPSAPQGTLTYSLQNPPTGASIDTNGVIAWTPSEAQGPSTNTFTTIVTDSGIPPLSATNSFNVVVNEINVPPVLPPQTNRAIVALTTLSVTNTASDADVPTNAIAYALTSAPTNAVIDSTGVITWTPVVAQVPSTNVFTTVVTDSNLLAVNSQHLSATNSFTVVVSAIHNGPSLAAQTNRTINELTALVLTNAATDNDIPSRQLTYSLLNAPSGASIDTNGVITWTPTEAQGPSTNTFTTVVTDDGTPQLSATNTFTVTVNEINVAPILPAQANRTILGLTSLIVTNTATDSDLPANALTYSLLNAPTNAAIDADGVISWAPESDQVPSTNVFTTVVTDFNPSAVNNQHSSATNVFTVVVASIHNGPTLALQTNRTIDELTALVLTNTATDNDIPLRQLTYSLLNAPSGASIDTNGVITWTPSELQGPTTNIITTVVTDDGTPQLGATNTFTVTVNEINVAPILPAQADRTIAGLTSLVVTNAATDSDLPSNTLAYMLLSAPTNAVIDGGGVISWTPESDQVPSTNVFTTVVTDFNPSAVNAQHLSATNVFTVVVASIHNGPVLGSQTNRAIDELTQLVVTNAAADSDIPLRKLTYELIDPPSGAVIDTNGVITWTPTEAQGPSTNTLTTIVADDGNPQLSSTNTFVVIVNEINTPPSLLPQPDRTITGLTTLVVTNTATDADLPANGLTYFLLSAPTNASINPFGVIDWTPTSAQVPSTNIFVTVVTDSNPLAVNTQQLSITNTFQVIVSAIHNGPQLPLQTNLTIAELTTLIVTNTAGDGDIPAHVLTYFLLNAPVGAAIDTNGMISWTPTEAQGPSTNIIITVVMDDGNPVLSATNSFTVIVNEINVPPVLPAQPDLTIIGLTALTVTNTATDSDIPSNALTYSLLSAPINTVIDANGMISWTPEIDQVPSTNVFTTVVTDFNPSAVNAQHLSATNVFTVVVASIHNGPVLALQTNRTMDELTELVVTNSAIDSDIPLRKLTYQLVDPPSGASIDTNGVITWTPTELEGPTTNIITTVVTDDGTPQLSATNSFTVAVNEINVAPVLPSQADRTIIGLTSLTVTNTATDSDLPSNTLTYMLLSAPTNATIDTDGVISWTPEIDQVPSTNVFTTVVTDFNPSAVNSQHLSATNVFTVVVASIHNGPVLGSQTNQTINEQTELVVTNAAADDDIPLRKLTYELIDPPSGAVIDTNGVITWTPTEAQGPSTNTFTTIVADDGNPQLSSTNTFVVFVNEINTPPSLPSQPDRTTVGLTQLTVTNTASDADIPANTITYALLSAPTNAVMDSTGVITWTPAVAQVPSTNAFTTVATDSNPLAVNAQHLTATNSFTVVVSAIHNGPALASQTNRTLDELTELVVTNAAADNDIPLRKLSYELIDPPTGAVIDTNGVITWTPSELEGPATNIITTVVTDDGTPQLSATNTFTVTVNEINVAPVLPAQPDLTIIGLTALTVTNTATDSDIPANALTYSLLSAPTNAVIDTDGVISWIPEIDQVPSTNVFTTVVTDFNPSAVNSQHLSATNVFTVVVASIHNGPVLALQTNRTIDELTELFVTNSATDNDIPLRKLTYQLIDPPSGAVIDTNGVITWTPSEAQGPSTNTFTTIVSDDGNSQLSSTNTFVVFVNEINTPPSLSLQPDRTITGLTTLVVTNTATDADLPANGLTYFLLSAPANASIDPSGVINWTPVIAQVPSTNMFTTVVTDSNPLAVNSQQLSTTNTFKVVVNVIHNGPRLPLQINLTIAELTTLVITNAASDEDVPAHVLNYSLLDAPVGAAIDTNGVISWTPTEAQGPSTNIITTVVIDDGTPVLSTTNSFMVIVDEINSAPILPLQTNREITGLVTLLVTNTASDSDEPFNTLTYSLLEGPTNAIIDSAGVITWTPVIAQIPGTNTFTTMVTDSNPWAVNSQQLSATNTFTVVVNAIHNGPILPAQTNIMLTEPATLVVTNTATDNDIPTLALTYQLVNPPTGATINTNGVITWTPTESEAPSTNVFETIVTDIPNGPALTATNSFVVVVLRPVVVPPPLIQSIKISDGNVTLIWSTVAGRSYRLQYCDDLNLANWTDIVADISASETTASLTIPAGESEQRFYRVFLLP